MKRIGVRVSCLSMFVVLPAIAAAPAPYSNEDVIQYRRSIMHSLNEQGNALGQILTTMVPDDTVVELLESIALTASLSLKSFEPKVEGSESSPDVWAQWPDFSKRMNEFAQKTAEMAKAAREKGKSAGLEHVVDALSCKSCHDIYRTGVEE